MSLEKPISTIRKAVKYVAENTAKDEGLIKPEDRHYKQVFDLYKKIRPLNPVVLEKTIFFAANNKNRKDKLGSELYKIFSHAWNEVFDAYKTKLISISEGREKNKKIKLQQLIREMANEVKNNPEVAVAFSENKELLNESINLSTDEIIYVLELGIPGLI